MSQQQPTSLPALIETHHLKLTQEWIAAQLAGGAAKTGQIRDSELREQCERFLNALRRGVVAGVLPDLAAAAWEPMRDILEEVSRSRALQGFSPAETAFFVFALKDPIFA